MAPESVTSGQLDVETERKLGHSDSPVESGELGDMTPEEERRLVRKLDINIFPILVVLYILSFLDRVNIGKFTHLSCSFLGSELED